MSLSKNPSQHELVSEVRNNKANKTDPISQFTQDSTHRTVTDTDKATWNSKSKIIYSNVTVNGTLIVNGIATFE